MSSSQEKLGSTKAGLSRRGNGTQSRKGVSSSSSIRSSRQLGRSIRGTASSTGGAKDNNAAANAAANVNRIIVEGIDMTPRSLLFPHEYEPLVSSSGGGGGGQNNTSVSKIGSQSRSNLSIKSRSNNLRSSVASSEGGNNSMRKSRGLTNTNKAKSPDTTANPAGGNGEAAGKGSNTEKGSTAKDGASAAAANQAAAQLAAAEQKENVAGSNSALLNKKQEVKLSNKELNAMVELALCETRTETLLHIVGICVSADSPECAAVTEQNATYDKMVDDRLSHADMYQSRHVQTFHLDVKHKDVSVAPVPTCETGCQAASWDIFDAEQRRERVANDAIVTGGGIGGGGVGGDGASGSGVSDSIIASGSHMAGATIDVSVASGASKASRLRGSEEVALTRRVNNSVALSLASPGCLLSLAIDQPRTKSTNPNSTNSRHGGGGGGSKSQRGTGGGTNRVSARSSTTSSTSIGVGSDTGTSLNSARSTGTASNARDAGSGMDSASAESVKDGGQVIAAREAQAIMSSPQLLDSLRTVERTIQQNIYHTKHIEYRAMSALADLAALETSSVVSGKGDNNNNNNNAENSDVAGKNNSGENDSDNSNAQGTPDAGTAGESTDAAAAAAAGATGAGADANGASDATSNGVASGNTGSDQTDPSEDTSTANQTGGSSGQDVSGESAVGDLNVDDDNTATSVSGAVGSSALANQRSTMDLLWKFECPESKGRSVTAMAWNHANPDLLAVAYGDFQFKKDQKGGAILFWTLKNPEFPEEIVYTESGVCSIDFSTTHPSLLAAGMSDGNVAIYDLRDSGSGGVLAMTGMKGGANANDTKGAGAGGKGGDSRDGSGAAKGNGAGASSASAAGAVGVDDVTAELLAGGAAGICEGNTGNGAAGAHTSLQPVLESAKLAAADQHTDAVWQVRWVSRKDSIHGRSNEVLVSISLDGRVTEWSLRKGLTATDLMVLKRVNSSARGGLPTGEGIISRTAAGLCFDFPSDDSTVYLAGTEDGTIHKCSCSYNEQYLESYFGHAGPVNKVHCSPFVPHIFLSCSADWTMKLWDAHKADKEILTFQAVDLSDVVHDVCWSPNISTLFGSVTGDGRLEVWDLARSTLDPVMTWKRSEHVTDEHGNSSTHDATPPSDHPADELDSVSGGGTGKYSSGTSSENRDLRAGSKKAKAQQAEASIAAHYCAIGFARNAPVLVAGDSNGSVDVFRLTGHESSLPSAGANLPAHGFQSPIVDDDIDSASAGPSVAAQQATRLLDAICQDKAMT